MKNLFEKRVTKRIFRTAIAALIELIILGLITTVITLNVIMPMLESGTPIITMGWAIGSLIGFSVLLYQHGSPLLS